MATSSKAELRRCVGSKTFGIAPHAAPIAEFPSQPSRKDGLGVMCKRHWSAYTNALRKAAAARKTAEREVVATPAPSDGRATPPKAKRASREEAATPKPARADAQRKAATGRARRSPTGASADDVPASVARFIESNGGSLPIEPRAED
jgi:hypothetical protein